MSWQLISMSLIILVSKKWYWCKGKWENTQCYPLEQIKVTLYCCSTFHSHHMVLNNEHITHTLQWVWTIPNLQLSGGILYLSIKATSGHFFQCRLVYRIYFPDAVIKKKYCHHYTQHPITTKHLWNNLTNTVIIIHNIP